MQRAWACCWSSENGLVAAGMIVDAARLFFWGVLLYVARRLVLTQPKGLLVFGFFGGRVADGAAAQGFCRFFLLFWVFWLPPGCGCCLGCCPRRVYDDCRKDRRSAKDQFGETSVRGRVQHRRYKESSAWCLEMEMEADMYVPHKRKPLSTTKYTGSGRSRMVSSHDKTSLSQLLNLHQFP